MFIYHPTLQRQNTRVVKGFFPCNELMLLNITSKVGSCSIMFNQRLQNDTVALKHHYIMGNNMPHILVKCMDVIFTKMDSIELLD